MQQTLAEGLVGPRDHPDKGAAPTDGVAPSLKTCGGLVQPAALLSPRRFFCHSYLTFEKCFDSFGSWATSGMQGNTMYPLSQRTSTGGQEETPWQQPQGSPDCGCASLPDDRIPRAPPTEHSRTDEEEGRASLPPGAWASLGGGHYEYPGKGSLTVLRRGPGPWRYRQREQAGSGNCLSCWVWVLGPVPRLRNPWSRALGWKLGTSVPLCAAENLFCVSRFSLQRRFLSRSLVLYTLTRVAAFCPL